MNLTLTIGRASLSLPDLVITNNPFGATFWLPEEGLEEPTVDWRLTYYPDAPDIAGKALRAAVLEHTAIPAAIYTQASDAATLQANKRELLNALGQFSYSVTLDLDGAADTYDADPCGPRWGPVDSGMVRSRIARAEVLIPVYPIPS